MIGLFPDGRPDELAYSICSRYADIMNYSSPESVMRDLFGTTTLKAVVDLPGRLDTLVDTLPAGHRYDIDYIINHHTLFRYYAPFLPPQRYASIKDGMMGPRTQGVHLSLGVIACQIKLPKHLQFCPICAEEERGSLGECYWHRLHQVPGVLVCPQHNVWLEESIVPAHGSRAYISAEKTIVGEQPRYLNPNTSLSHVLVAIAQASAWLLRQELVPEGLEKLRERHLASLISRGMATHSGRVRTKKMLQAFKDRYDPELLALLNCEIDGRSRRNWLARMVQANQPQSPIRHLLLMHMLEYTPEVFFSLDTIVKSFGNGPWLCLNPVCTDYMRPVISECSLGFSPNMQRRPLGTFACPHCGFTYSRVGPDQSPQDSMRIGRIITYGRIWERMLGQMWLDPSVTIRECARRLGVNQETVRHHASRLGLPQQRGTRRSSELSALPAENRQASLNIEQCKEMWLQELNEVPQPNLTQLIQRLPTVYRTLYRFDADWLAAHKPPVNRKRKWTPIPVDWDARDQWLAKQVDDIVSRLKNRRDRMARVTANAIAKEIGWKEGKLQSDLKNMPRSAEKITSVVETPEQFAIRRIERLMKLYMKAGVCPSRSEFIKRAGLSLAIQTPPVVKRIEQTLDRLQLKK